MWILRLRFWFWLQRKHPKLFRKLNKEHGLSEEKREKLQRATMAVQCAALVLEFVLLILCLTLR